MINEKNLIKKIGARENWPKSFLAKILDKYYWIAVVVGAAVIVLAVNLFQSFVIIKFIKYLWN